MLFSSCSPYCSSALFLQIFPVSVTGKLAQTKGYWFPGAKKVQGMYSNAQHWLWFGQEDTPLSSKWFQEICGAQYERAWTVDDAQQVAFLL